MASLLIKKSPAGFPAGPLHFNPKRLTVYSLTA